MDAAKSQLAEREGISNVNAKSVGFWDRVSGESRGMAEETIATWATARDLSGVVWTSLSCGLAGQRGVIPGGDEIIGYLRTLRGADLATAEEHVRRTPVQINAEYRQLIERELGWIYSSRPGGPV